MRRQTARAAKIVDALRAQVAVAPARAREPALEAQIAEDPSDASRYLVYADWLQTRNDARGLLIMLHHAMHEAPGDRARALAAAAFVDEHAASLLGPLAPYVPIAVELEWYLGFIKRATIARASTELVLEAVTALLASPSARFLQELVVEPHPGLPVEPARIVRLLLDVRRPQTLAHVAIGKPGSWTVPAELRAAFPRLARDPAEVWRDAMARAAEQKKLKVELDATRMPPLEPRVAGVAADPRAILVGIKAELDKHRPLGVLAAMPHVFTRESLDAFALALAKEWQQLGDAPRWPFDALGPLGGERCVRWISAQLAGWSHQRAVQAIQHLVRIGSDAALYEIVTLALAPRTFGARRLEAVAALDVVAKQRKLRDRDALIVRIGPTTASERVLKTQRTWLESLMLDGQRLAVDELRTYVAGNAIRRPLASTLVWADYRRGAIAGLFRLDATGWFERLGGGTYATARSSSIGLPHPAELAPEQLARARRAAGEQAILQLERPVFSLRTDEARRTRLTRFARRRVGYVALQTAFEQRGWTEERDEDTGFTVGWAKLFARDGVVATAKIDDRAGAIASVEVQARGVGPPRPFATLHPVTLSELLWDLEIAHGAPDPVPAASVERPRPIMVERAKTGRSKCTVCGQSIAKDAQRIGVERRIETPAYTGRARVWLHPACRAGAPELADIDVDALLDP